MSKDAKKMETEQPWGMLSCIDLYNCDPEIIRNDKKIKEFVGELCDLIKMKRFGETQVVHFGEDVGMGSGQANCLKLLKNRRKNTLI